MWGAVTESGLSERSIYDAGTCTVIIKHDGPGDQINAIQGLAPPHRRRDQRLGPWSAWLLVQGVTEEEALENIRDAIREYLAARRPDSETP